MSDIDFAASGNGPETAARGSALLLPGQSLNGYRITDVLSVGGQSLTYRAIEIASGEAVVVKLSHADARSRDDLRREAEALQAVQDPNVVRIRGTGAHGEAAYLAMDFVAGTALAETLSTRAEPFDQAALWDLLNPVLDALAATHEAGYLHRDVTPRNIILRPQGGPVLTDFGSARPMAASVSDRSTATEATPGYAPIEQYLDGGREGPWTDLYALAAVAYRAISGAAPPDARARSHGAPLIPATATGRDLCSPAFLQALDWALQPEPEARPRTVVDWRQALEAAKVPEGAPQGVAASGDGPSAETGVPLPPEDEVPATEKLARLPAPAMAAPELRADGPELSLQRPKGGGGRGLFAGLLVVLVCAAAVGGWWGWQRYGLSLKDEVTVGLEGAGDTSSIADALARARTGATIYVLPGVYRESLVMDRPLHLIGAGDDSTMPRIVAPGGNCLLATAESGTVRGLAFEGGDASGSCLDIAGGAILVADNLIENWNGVAMRLRDGAQAQVSGNLLSHVEGPGVVVERGAGGVILDNQIEDTGKAGIIVRGGAAPSVTGNRIENTGQAGLLISEGSGGRFANNDILASAASGIEVRNGADPTVEENRIEASAQAGIFVYDGSSGEYRDNMIVGNGFSGVVIAGGSAPILQGNEIRENGEHGILILDSATGRVEDNSIIENGGHGIALGPTNTSELGKNELKGNRRPQVRKGRVEPQ